VRHCSSQQLCGESAAEAGVFLVLVLGGLMLLSCRLGLDWREPTGVHGEEKQPEVGVALVVEDVVEVELDVGLPGQARCVAKHTKLVSVGDQAPQVAGGAVEEVLHHRLRGAGGLTRRSGVQLHPGPDQVHGQAHLGVGGIVGPGQPVRDREAHRLGLAQAGRCLDSAAQCLWSAEAQLVEQWKQPGAAGDGDGRVARRQPLHCSPPHPVGAQARLPRTRRRGVDRHAGRELVVLGSLAGHAQVDGTGERIAGQHRADRADRSERRQRRRRHDTLPAGR